jgi:glycosyltransferase 2 family protein
VEGRSAAAGDGIQEMIKMGRAFQAGLGLAIGAFFLWLALRGVSGEEIRSLIAAVRLKWVALALCLYGGGLFLRVIRWHSLLSVLVSASRARVTEALLVGYAFNNLLPARLGELVRADYAKRRMGVTRSAILGSIVVERLLDVFIVVLSLSGGLLVLSFGARHRVEGFEMLQFVSFTGALGASVALLSVGCVLWLRRRGFGFPVLVQRLIADLSDGLQTFGRVNTLQLLLLSGGVWLLEGGAMWSVVRSLDVNLGIAQSAVLLGAASLSTLVPTAPGYLGSYQFAFALTLSTFSFSVATGIVAASIAQVFLLGSVTVSGLAIYMLRSFHGLVSQVD